MTPEPENLIAIHEAIRLTGLDKGTLYRLARRKKIRAFKVLGRALRFERSDVCALVAAYAPARESAGA
jgi:excisionase family DNA binding protein